MKQYTVTGMSCAACSARVEKAVTALPGVLNCSVNLLTGSMTVDGSVDAKTVIKAVEKAGYGAELQNEKRSSPQKNEEKEDRKNTLLIIRLVSSLFFLLILIYFSMGHAMWGFPLPSFFEENAVATGLMQLLLAGAVMIINQRFFINGFKGLLHLSPNMDTLVALGSGAAFLYSTVSLFAMIDAQQKGNMAAVKEYASGLYFESAAMILALITVGKMLEAHSKGKTTDAIRRLLELSPQTATLIKNGKEETVPVEQVKVGDVFAVRPGEHIPVDGTVIKGSGSVDESALTGESIPSDKEEGAAVYAATVNRSGYLECQATKVGADTALSQIVKMVSDASASKAPIAKIADKVSGIFVPVVMAIATVTAVIWLAVSKDVGFSLARGISVLVISCPCALGLATPVAIMVGNGVAAKKGILFKNASALENTGKTTVVALDKTGTVTKGEPTVTDLLPASGYTEEMLLRYSYALEKKSEHPLAKAVVKKAENAATALLEVTRFEVLPGNGLRAETEGKEIIGGSLTYIEKNAFLTEEIRQKAISLSLEGKTPLLFAIDKKTIGIIAVSDVIKPDSRDAVRQLKELGVRVVMITGDNQNTAESIGNQAGIDEVFAGVLPNEKAEVIQKLKSQGKVAMVGDGINDAPALTSADIGIAIGAGTDIAIDSADIVLMNSTLSDVPAAIRLSRKTLKNIKENLFWAFFYNAICIPVAAGAFVSLFGWALSPMLGAAAMSLSSFCVVSNALRLNFIDIYSFKQTHKKKINKNVEINEKDEKENITMNKTMKIEGMMCAHCSGRVKKALEALPEVESATVSHESGTAVVCLAKSIPDATLKMTVEDEGYTVTEIQ